mmetsp:Transcript_22526/g.67567  ORF Transcript_22526/g.67567 Transcript_22526/m.67567 type:complete len:391 (+) Transcript_22526:853-2025(+)
MLQELDDSLLQFHVDLFLLQVTPQHPKLLDAVALHVAQGRHRACDAPDNCAERDQGEEENDDGEDALRHVHCEHVHRRGGELGQTPVQGRGVLPRVALVMNRRLASVFDPTPVLDVACEVPDQEPHASDHMVEDQDEAQQADQIQDDEGVLTVDHIVHAVHDALQLEQPQQSQHPDRPRRAEDAPYSNQVSCPAAIARGAPRPLEGAHDPIWHHDEEVNDEPGLQVSRDDLLVVGDQDALLVMVQEKGLDHVQRPENEGQPAHEDDESVIGHVEDHHGDVDQVPSDQREAKDIPRKAACACRPDRARPHPPLPRDVVQAHSRATGAVAGRVADDGALHVLARALVGIEHGLDVLAPEHTAVHLGRDLPCGPQNEADVRHNRPLVGDGLGR